MLELPCLAQNHSSQALELSVGTHLLLQVRVASCLLSWKELALRPMLPTLRPLLRLLEAVCLLRWGWQSYWEETRQPDDQEILLDPRFRTSHIKEMNLPLMLRARPRRGSHGMKETKHCWESFDLACAVFR
jgi:hypothetical protein